MKRLSLLFFLSMLLFFLVKAQVTSDSNRVVDWSEQLLMIEYSTPEYEGGQAAIDSFVRSYIVLYADSLPIIEEGTVIISFLLDKKGNTIQHKIEAGEDLGFTPLLMMAVKALPPRWVWASGGARRYRNMRIHLPLRVSFF